MADRCNKCKKEDATHIVIVDGLESIQCRICSANTAISSLKSGYDFSRISLDYARKNK